MSAGNTLNAPVVTQHRWAALSTLLLGTLVGSMNNSVANVALPAVLDDLGIAIGAGVWFVTSYVLTLSVLLPAAGRLADMFGTRRLYLWSLYLFLVSTAMVAIAPTYPLILAARAVQGIAQAAVLPVLMVTIGALFSSGERGKAVGAWATVNGMALALGPLIGGITTDLFGWRAFFWGNLPVIALMVPLTLRYLPNVSPRRRGGFDTLGAGLLAAGLGGLMLALSRAPDWGWTSRPILALFTGGGLLLSAFFLRCARRHDAFIDLDLFRDRRYGLLSAVAGLQMATVYGVMLITPLVLITVFGYGLALAGALVFLLPLALAIGSPVLGHLTDRHGVRRVISAGGLALLVASLVMVPAILSERLPFVLAALVLFGLGAAAIQSPSAAGVTETVAADSAGLAQGTFHTIRFLSGVMGATAFATVLGALTESPGAFAATYALAVTFALAAVLAARTLPSITRVGQRAGERS